MTHPDTLQRAAFEAWANAAKLDTARCCKDSWGEATYLPHIDAMWAGWQAALQPQATPPDPADLLRDALSNLNDLADQKNAEIDALKEAMRLALERMQGFALWADSQADAQSKGGHATFDIMELREQRDMTNAAIAALEKLVDV